MICCNKSQSVCYDKFGCPEGVCVDFLIKRFDTKPLLEFLAKDCSEWMDLTDCVLEVSMWANAKLKKAIGQDDDYFAFADDIGFYQVFSNDILVFGDNARSVEYALVTGIDEENKLIQVQRGYQGTTKLSHKKGAPLKIFRFINSTGITQMSYKDIENLDGSIDEDVLVESKLIYEWQSQDTILPGCYWLELKLLKMKESSTLTSTSFLNDDDIIPSFSFITPSSLGFDGLGENVEWARRFPIDREGFLIKIQDSPNSELLS